MILPRISIRKHQPENSVCLWLYLLAVASIWGCLLYGKQSTYHFAILPSPVAFAQTTSEQTSIPIDLHSWVEIPTENEENYWNITSPNSAEAYLDRGNSRSMLVPDEGDWNNAWQNYSFSFDVMQSEGVDLNLLFHFKDALNWYEFHIKYGSYQLVRVEHGDVTYQAFGEIEIEQGSSYSIEIRTQGDLRQIFLNGQLIGSHYDWTHSEDSTGSIGLRATTGAIFPTKVSFSNIAVSILETIRDDPDIPSPSPSAALPHYFQSDHRWANDTYDHAQNWDESNQPTMVRWGCLTTSMAMIMRFYGIDRVPIGNTYSKDGPELTPATLNDWLRSQPDGYLGDGLFNWIAATRLTRMVGEATGSPKLEYSVAIGQNLSASQQQFALQQPVIFNLPGHFVVGSPKNWNPNNPTHIPILDPFYAVDTLDQYGEIKENSSQTLLSTRVLTPSHTDLSYFVFVHSPEVQLELLDKNSQLEISILTTQDFITPTSQTEDWQQNKTDTLITSLVPKPTAGLYTLRLRSAFPQHHHIQFFAYNAQAELADFQLDTWTTSHPLEIDITTDPKLDNELTKKHTAISHRFSDNDFLAELATIQASSPPESIQSLIYQLELLFSLPYLSQKLKVELATYLVQLYNLCLSQELLAFFESRLSLLSALLEISADS